jgi:hypothetical protein
MKEEILKFRNLAFVIISSLLIYSCSKSSDKASITGNWTFDDATFSTTVNGQNMTDYLVNVLGYSTTQAQAFITLFDESVKQKFDGTFDVKSDGTYMSDLGGEQDNGTWSLSSDNKTLIISSDYADPVTLDVIQLTKSLLEVKTVETLQEDLNQDEVTETLVVTVDITFKK